MPNCPKCGSRLDEFKGKFVCSDAECDFAVSKAKFAHAQRPWHARLCRDEALWHPEVFERYPSIVAHEYWRLYDLLDQGQPYGAFLQLKDIFEVLIKFPTLIMASVIYRKRERTDVENKLLIALLEKWLTLGTWEEIARTMGNKVEPVPGISEIQQDVVALFHAHEIREWRNKAIGHGALAFDADEDFQQDIENKLRLVTTHFQQYTTLYASLVCCLVAHDGQQRIILAGKDHARNLDYPETDIRIQIGERLDLSLSPYILLRDRSIYFFDSYVPREKKTVILTYPEGDKQHISNAELTSLYGTLSRDYTFQSFSSSLGDETFSALEVETLDKIAAIDDFQKPMYLKYWLKDMVTQHAKGIFLLQMERGMGKSTFARALDHQAMSRIHVDDPDEFSVRCYYIDSAYAYKVENFTSKISFVFVTDPNGRIVIQGNLPVLSASSDHKPDDFAALLNFYRREHQKHFQREHLLCVLDGLDEIPANESGSLFDFLPSPDLLDDGVYLLLTCRTDPEIAHFTRKHLSRLILTDRLQVTRDDLRHVDVLRAYISNQIGTQEKHRMALLLDKSENRFLYLKTIKELLQSVKKPEDVDLSNGKALFHDFLNTLRCAYGEKFFAGVVKLLAILSTAYVPLTLKEISYLFGEAKPTFKLLAHLIDLRGFLKAEHSYRGNLLSIAHPDLRDVICEHYRAVLQNLIRRWVADHSAVPGDDIAGEDEGEIYLLIHLPDYVATYAETLSAQIFTPAYAECLSKVAKSLQKTSLAEHHREQILHIYTAITAIQERLIQTGVLPDEQELAGTLMRRGRAYLNMRRITDGIADYDRAVTIWKDLLASGKSQDRNRLAAALINRGTAYMHIQDIERAIADYGQAIAIRQSLLEAGTLSDECSLARIFVNRGNAYRRLNRLDEALTDFDAAIAIQQRCFDAGTLAREEELAAAFMNRGIVYMQRHDVANAILDYDWAIELQQQLLHAGKLPDEGNLARALLNRASLYQGQHLLQQALDDYSRVLEIQEKLLQTGRLINENELARTYVNRGIVYRAVHQPQRGLADYNCAIAIQEQLLRDDMLWEQHELAWALWNRAEASIRIRQIDQAIQDCDRALSIYQELLRAGKLPDGREMALTLVNRGIAYTQKGAFEQALQDLFQAITQQQTEQLPDEDLAWALLHRGIAYRETRQFTEALRDFDQAIALQQQLQAEERLPDDHDLALTLMHRGIMYKETQKPEEALHDLRQACAITRALLPKRAFLLGTYTQSVFYALSILQASGQQDDIMRLMEAAEDIFRNYELTEDAQFWQNQIATI